MEQPTELEIVIRELLEKEKRIAELNTNTRILKVVKSIYDQKRISDEVAQTLLLELTMDLE
jgi:hypothetical protein